MSKRVDLVTLPGKDTVKEKGFCYHKDINDWVTERMCCAKWDGEGVIRDYKGESPLMEQSDKYDVDYMKGHCHVMALALKQLHPDWKIRAHVGWDDDESEDHRVDHVYIVSPDGSAYDCRGKFSNEKELVGSDETGGTETQFVDYDIQNIKADIARGELKKFTKDDLVKAIKQAKKIKLDEILDPTTAAPLKWTEEKFLSGRDKDQYIAHTATAKDKKKNTLKYNFYYYPTDDITVVEFSRTGYPWYSGGYDLDRRGDQYTVFATLLEAIKQYLSDYKPKYMLFGAKEPSRIKLYQAFVDRYAKQFGYKQINSSMLPRGLYDYMISRNETPFFLARSDAKEPAVEGASGYIPSEKEKNDPRFKTALTVDVKPDSIQKNARAFGFKVSRAGIPPLLRK